MPDIESYRPERYKDLIEHIWLIKNGAQSIDVIVPPSPYLNIIFPLNDTHYYFNQTLVSDPQLEGLSLQTHQLRYPAHTSILGIRFYPYGLYPFVPLHPKLHINSSNPAQLFIKGVNFARIKAITDTSKAIHEVYQLLDKLYSAKRDASIALIKDFYKFYRTGKEELGIEDYCTQIGSNYCTLNRKLSKVIGISPKKLERLLRFRKSICSLTDSTEKLTQISTEAGYFDQAHFIREFKWFVSQTPSSYQNRIKSSPNDSVLINYNFRLF